MPAVRLRALPLFLALLAPLIAATPAHADPPTVQVTSPLPDAVITGPTTFAATASPVTESATLAHVTFYVGGTQVGQDDTAPYEVPWTPGPADEGTTSIQAVATDSNAESATASVQVIVDLPAGVTGLIGRAGDRLASLGWTLPEPVASVVVSRLPGWAAPATPGAGTVVLNTPASGHVDRGLVNGTVYSYGVWTRNEAGTLSPRATVSVRPVPAKPTVLVLGGLPGLVAYGQTIGIPGRLTLGDRTTGVGGEPVYAYVRRQGTAAWSFLASATTRADGRFGFTHKPAWNAEYTLRHPATPYFTASASGVGRVAVRPVLTARINLAAALVGTTATVSGAISPAHAGQPIHLQQLTANGWQTVASRALGSTGGYAFGVRPATSGVFRYRVLKPADADHAAVAGGTLAFTTYRVVIARIDAPAEYAVLRNTGAVAVNLLGWRLDASDAQVFTLPSYGLAPGASVLVHTGPGANAAGHLYLGRGSAIWNNDGDVGSLFDPRGALASRVGY